MSASIQQTLEINMKGLTKFRCWLYPKIMMMVIENKQLMKLF